MAGSLRGQRLGQTRHGTPTGIDPDDERRRVGLLLRELRINAGMRMKDVVEAVNGRLPDASWTVDTVSLIQTGRRHLRLREMRALAQIFSVSWDAILETALGSGEIPDPVRLDDELVTWANDMPPFAAHQGQKEHIQDLATRVGVSRNEMGRRLWAVAIPAYKDWLDRHGR